MLTLKLRFRKKMLTLNIDRDRESTVGKVELILYLKLGIELFVSYMFCVRVNFQT